LKDPLTFIWVKEKRTGGREYRKGGQIHSKKTHRSWYEKNGSPKCTLLREKKTAFRLDVRVRKGDGGDN